MRNGKRAAHFARGLSISRRQALQGIGVGVSALALGCDGSGAMDPMAMDPNAMPMMTPKELLAGIDSIVVLMMENRSFDHYLGALRSDNGYASQGDVDGLRGTESNPDPMGVAVPVFRTTNRTPKDPPHGWDACHAQWNSGKNDGFVREHASAGTEKVEVMGFHDRSEIPLYYALADRFTVCDRWFASVMGPTWPNRYYLHAASSFGKKDNTPINDKMAQTVWDGLAKKGLQGKNYHDGLVAFYSGGFIGKALAGVNPVAKLDDFFNDCKTGKLPPFAILDPDFLSNDDHPSHDINLGQAFASTIVQAVAQSPQWARTLLCITYDEHGGFFDHVAPPTCADELPDFRQLGFRVPSLIMGGAVRTGVNHTQLEHASVAATLKTRFDIASLGQRMDAANDLSSCIDPVRLKEPTAPPTDLPKTPVRLRQALSRAATAESSQPELMALVQSGAILRHHLDQRPADERLHAWLEYGQRLGAVELLD